MTKQKVKAVQQFVTASRLWELTCHMGSHSITPAMQER